jgi:hypothetical protein
MRVVDEQFNTLPIYRDRAITRLLTFGKHSIWFIWFVWLIWFIWLVSFNQINKTNQTNQMN